MTLAFGVAARDAFLQEAPFPTDPHLVHRAVPRRVAGI